MTNSREPTYRELRALRLMAYGLDYREIAKKMGLTENTVGSYMRLCMIKLGANNRAHLVYLACKTGLIKLDDDHE